MPCRLTSSTKTPCPWTSRRSSFRGTLWPFQLSAGPSTSFLALGEPLDRLDGRAVCLDGQQHAALHERAVDDHRAGAAVAGVAADVAAGQVEVVADEVDEEPARLDLTLVRRAVDRDLDRPG